MTFYRVAFFLFVIMPCLSKHGAILKVEFELSRVCKNFLISLLLPFLNVSPLVFSLHDFSNSQGGKDLPHYVAGWWGVPRAGWYSRSNTNVDRLSTSWHFWRKFRCSPQKCGALLFLLFHLYCLCTLGTAISTPNDLQAGPFWRFLKNKVVVELGSQSFMAAESLGNVNASPFKNTKPFDCYHPPVPVITSRQSAVILIFGITNIFGSCLTEWPSHHRFPLEPKRSPSLLTWPQRRCRRT